MNCKQLEELLPLYAGHDLDEKRARLVSEHLQICSACAQVAGEYQETVELTQQFAPPVFSDNVYASVRRRVMQQIEAEPTAPLLPQMFASWFRPRVTWAVASALVISFGFFALYLVVNRGVEVQPVAGNRPTLTDTPRSIATPPKINPTNFGTTLKPTEDKGGIRRVVSRPPKARDSSLRTAVISRQLRDPAATNNLPAVDAVPGESPLRVEIQTRDPNIRIIWFSQSNSKPALPNSKGI